MADKLLLSKRETAQLLGLSVRSIEHLIANKRLMARRVGGRVLVPYSACQIFVRSDHPDPITSSPDKNREPTN